MLRKAASTAGHMLSWSGVKCSRVLMLAIWASLRRKPGRPPRREVASASAFGAGRAALAVATFASLFAGTASATGIARTGVVSEADGETVIAGDAGCGWDGTRCGRVSGNIGSGLKSARSLSPNIIGGAPTAFTAIG